MADFAGHCACGACTWVHPGPKKRGLLCHCDECRRGVACAFTAVQGFDPSAMDVRGPWRDYKLTPDSSRGFCGVCGTRLWFRSSHWSDDYFMNVGSMEAPETYQPDCHVVTREAVPWITIEDDIERHHGFSEPPNDDPSANGPATAGQDTPLSGTCLCGQVTWESHADALWAGHCHCDSCRRATGAPFASFFGLPRQSVRWAGEMAKHATSNGQVVRKFCTHCGTHMTYQNAKWPTEYHLYAASLNDPAGFQPTAHFHYAEKLPWVHVSGDLVKHNGSSEG